MLERLTILQAYATMFVFIRNYYYRLGKPAEIGNLLSDIQLVANGKPLEVSMWSAKEGAPQDPAMWGDWVEAVDAVMRDQKE